MRVVPPNTISNGKVPKMHFKVFFSKISIFFSKENNSNNFFSLILLKFLHNVNIIGITMFQSLKWGFIEVFTIIIARVILENVKEMIFVSRLFWPSNSFSKIDCQKFSPRDRLSNFFLVAKNIIETISTKFQLVPMLFTVRPFYGRNAVD